MTDKGFDGEEDELVGTLYSLLDTKSLLNCSCVYVIRNTVNGKEYVGKTHQLRRRVQSHISSSECKESILYKAIRKYGIENFDLEILELIPLDRKVSGDREIHHIRLRGTLAPAGYNMTEGGEGALGRKHSEEHKLRMKAIAAANPERIQKFREFAKKPKTDSHKLAIGLANSKPKLIKRYGEQAPCRKAVLLFEKDDLISKFFTTQKDLATYLGVDKTSISNWLKGKGCSIANIVVTSAE